MNNHLWNEDGTPKRPDPAFYDDPQMYAQSPFAELAQDEKDAVAEAYVNYARIRRLAREARTPEVGDIVHYWDEDETACRAAVVMETDSFSDAATLRVHIPHEAFQDWHVNHDEAKAKETWHWPCGEGR